MVKGYPQEPAPLVEGQWIGGDKATDDSPSQGQRPADWRTSETNQGSETTGALSCSTGLEFAGRLGSFE